MSNKILRDYESDLDKFLQTFDKNHPELSLSQEKEVEKFRRIYFLRDVENRPDEAVTIWKGF